MLTVTVSTTATYNASLGEFTLSGSGDVALQVPKFLQFALGKTLDLFSIGYYIVDISNDNADSYVQFYTTVLGTSVGIKVNFNGGVSVDPGIDVLHSIADAFNKVGDAIVSGWNSFVSLFGPLAGAAVYYDANNNFDFAHDPSTVTAINGTFHLAIPPGSTTGQIVVVGGVDHRPGSPMPHPHGPPRPRSRQPPPLSTKSCNKQEPPWWLPLPTFSSAFGLPTDINPLARCHIATARRRPLIAHAAFLRSSPRAVLPGR